MCSISNTAYLFIAGGIPKFPTFLSLTAVENDASSAKTACSVGHVCKRRVEKLSRCSQLSHYSVKVFTAVVGEELECLVQKCDSLKEITNCTEHLVDAVSRATNTIHSMVGVKSEAVIPDCKVLHFFTFLFTSLLSLSFSFPIKINLQEMTSKIKISLQGQSLLM